MNKKTRNHPLCERMPYIAVILGVIIPTLFMGVGGSLGQMISEEASNIGICIVEVIMMIIFKIWFSPDFKGFVKAEDSAKNICMIMLPFILFLIFALITPLFMGLPFYFNPSIKALTMGISAGFGEETMFRILALAITMRYVKKEKRLVTVILLSVIFGLTHLGNITQGADMFMSVVQVIHATFTGFLFSELFLMTGSAIFPIFAHGIYDYICFTTDPYLSADGILTQQYSAGQLVYDLVVAMIIGIFAFLLISKNKMAKANEIWDKKWNQV